LLAASAIMRSKVLMHRWLIVRDKNMPQVQLSKFKLFILNFGLMIVLATNKSIIRSKLLIMLFWISISWSICYSQERSLERNPKKAILISWKMVWSGDRIIIRNFDLMIKVSTSRKSWILISWNSTSWPWVQGLMVRITLINLVLGFRDKIIVRIEC